MDELRGTLAFRVRALGEATTPAESVGHVRLRPRWESAGETLQRVVLDPRSPAMGAEERGQALEKWVREVVFPLLERGSTVAGLQGLYAAGTLGEALLAVGAREVLTGG